MSTLNPDVQGTGALPAVTVIDDRAAHRKPTPRPEIHGAAMLAVSIAAVLLAGFAWLLAPTWPFLAVPVAVLAFALGAAIAIPDALGAHYDRLRAAEEASE